ncbi:Abi family protein [Flavihumibacter petaseus]|uniref:Abi-like protein n=1 Tax=Flavihumibacter petaseus NBRC 106054 TaxID=1220578 RepID=A0A0E9MTJ2_9BACT|nr:Abi family protein [Flavihumibacter petaseus]GAO41082.1 hypothetical protein FPE01S_01_00940 [Flavihumibacter petaseus NBRC 106054]
MKFEKVRLYLSLQCIDRYLIATGNQKTRAVRLYKANLKIAQSFHPILGILEVALRNRLNMVLSAHFCDPDWIINQKNGFMIAPSLTHIDRKTGKLVTNAFLKTSVEKSEKKFRRLNVPITSGKILADQSLGFWSGLFEVHHYKLLLGRPIQVFNNLPTGHGRSNVCVKLNIVRQFRNRINHNEPICFNGYTIDFTYVESFYKAIVDIFTWIDPDLVHWIKDIDNTETKIARAKAI